MKYAVITAARNEADYFAQAIQSLTTQTCLPVRWVIVDDGSTDGTTAIGQALAQQNDWVTFVRRADRGFRQVGVGNYDALQDGLRLLADEDYEFLSIIDADVSFGPTYFAELLTEFDRNPQLGIAGGAVYDVVQDQLFKADLLPEMTGGGLKCYRRACYEEIGGLVRAASWDAIDCYQAMRFGWQSRTFDQPDLKIMHWRPTGASQDSVYVGRRRRGEGMYFMGAHPVWVWASALRRLFEPPVVLGSLYVLAGYYREGWRGAARINDHAFIQFVRRWQMRRLAGLLWRPL